MKLSTIAALAVSGAMFVAFVFLVSRGQAGEAMMMAGASVATLLLLGQTLSDQATKDKMVHELRARGIQQIETSLMMAKLAKASIEGRIPAGAIEVDAALREQNVNQGVQSLQVMIKATGLTQEGQHILAGIVHETRAGSRSPAHGFAGKESSVVKALSGFDKSV